MIVSRKVLLSLEVPGVFQRVCRAVCWANSHVDLRTGGAEDVSIEARRCRLRCRNQGTTSSMPHCCKFVLLLVLCWNMDGQNVNASDRNVLLIFWNEIAVSLDSSVATFLVSRSPKWPSNLISNDWNAVVLRYLRFALNFQSIFQDADLTSGFTSQARRSEIKRTEHKSFVFGIALSNEEDSQTAIEIATKSRLALDIIFGCITYSQRSSKAVLNVVAQKWW